jgi:hypothetical protein
MQQTMMPLSNNTFGSGNSNDSQSHRRFHLPTSLTVPSSLMNTMMNHHQGSQYLMNNMNGGYHSNGAGRGAAATHSVHNNNNRSQTQTQPVLPSSADRHQQQQQQQQQ